MTEARAAGRRRPVPCEAEDGDAVAGPLGRLFLRLNTPLPLGAEELDALRTLRMQRLVAPAGRDLVREGDAVDRVYIFQRSWGCRYATLEDGRRQILQILLPGDHVGDSAEVFSRSDHAVATLTEGPLLVLPSRDLLDAARRRPRLGVALEWSRWRDLAIMQRRLVDLGRRSALERTAHLLLELHHRLQLVGLGSARGYRLPLTQQTLADALGLTEVHVNRTLRRMAREGLARIDDQRVTILRPERLAEIAEFDEGYLHHGPVPGAPPPDENAA